MSSFEEKGSRRPDGTFRKVIKVRQGYVAPDEVEKYSTPMVRQEQSAPPRPSIPGLAPAVAPIEKITKKNKKQNDDNISNNSNEKNVNSNNSMKQEKKSIPIPNPIPSVTPEITNEKKIRNYEKKLREIDILDEIVKKGDVLNSDQLKKYEKKSEIESCIVALKGVKI